MTLATAYPPNPPAARQVAPVAKPATETRYYEMPDDYAPGKPPADGSPDFAYLADLKRVEEDTCGAYGEFVIYANADAKGDARSAHAADFGGPDGGLAIVTKEAYPADLLARALAAAYLVLRDEVYERLG